MDIVEKWMNRWTQITSIDFIDRVSSIRVSFDVNSNENCNEFFEDLVAEVNHVSLRYECM